MRLRRLAHERALYLGQRKYHALLEQRHVQLITHSLQAPLRQMRERVVAANQAIALRDGLKISPDQYVHRPNAKRDTRDAMVFAVRFDAHR